MTRVIAMILALMAASCAAFAQAVPERGTRTVTTRTFNADVVEMSTEILVIVTFWSTACAPCRNFRPQLERMIRATRDDVRLAFVDVDLNPELAHEHDANTLPLTLAYQDGALIGRLEGAANDARLRAFVLSPGPLTGRR